jgi:hypothetical protein
MSEFTEGAILGIVTGIFIGMFIVQKLIDIMSKIAGRKERISTKEKDILPTTPDRRGRRPGIAVNVMRAQVMPINRVSGEGLTMEVDRRNRTKLVKTMPEHPSTRNDHD